MAVVVVLGKLRHKHSLQCNQDSMGPLGAARWDKNRCGEGSLSPEDSCGTGGCAYWIVPVWLCTEIAYRVVSTPMELCHWAILVWLSPWDYATRADPTWLSPWG